MKQFFSGARKLMLAAFCLLTIVLPATAQLQGVDDFCAGIFNIPTPQHWNFMKYGNNDVQLYTGTATYSIPIYTYKDKDFEIPVSVDYASNGFIPNMQPCPTGLGWFLNCAGSIFREVRGLPDEKEAMYVTTPDSEVYILRGYLKNHKGAPYGYSDPAFYYEANNYLALPFYAYPHPNASSEMCEIESDIYHFKFGSHKGSFMLGPNGIIYVYDTNHPRGEYKVDLSQFGGPTTPREITITTGDGYKYIFGGNSLPYNLDYTISYNGMNPYPLSIPKVEHRISFLLTEIQAPNGRNVRFEYNQTGTYHIERLGYMINQVYDYFGVLSQVEAQWALAMTGSYNPISTGMSSYANHDIGEQYAAYLTKIIIDSGVEISFDYLKRYQEKGYRLGPMYNLGQLESIKVKNTQTGDTLKTCALSYSYSKHPQGNPIIFLDQVDISGLGQYAMEYYDKDQQFPLHGTTSIDHWGYYNGRGHGLYYDRFSGLCPVLRVDENFNEILTGTRNPDFASARMGLLKKITYPTKGYSYYEYEPHTYSRKIIRNYTTQSLPQLTYVDNNIVAGGVRVKKIVDYSSIIQEAGRKEYIYGDGIKSSGNLLHFPRYTDELRYNSYYDEFDIHTLSMIRHRVGYGYNIRKSCHSLSSYSWDKTHIEYSFVTVKHADQSYETHHFTNYESDPDICYTGGNYLRRRGYNILSSPILNRPVYTEIIYPRYADNYYVDAVSAHLQRGKPTLTQYFDSKGNKVAQERIGYTNCVDLYSTAEGMGVSEAYWYQKPILLTCYYPAYTEETKYFGNDSIVNTSFREFNPRGQLLAEYRVNGHDEQYITLYKYMFDRPEEGRNQENIEANFIKHPIEAMTFKTDGTVTDHTQCTYTLYGLSKVYKCYHAPDQSMWDHSPAELEFSVDKYDSKNNIVQTTSRNNISTSYIWGIGGLYLLGKIENATLDQVASIPGLQNLASMPLAGDLTPEQENSLRNMTGASVTTYRHKPFVGISMVKDPSGRSVQYEYDADSRLKYIIDDKGNILERYDYYLAN